MMHSKEGRKQGKKNSVVTGIVVVATVCVWQTELYRSMADADPFGAPETQEADPFAAPEAAPETEAAEVAPEAEADPFAVSFSVPGVVDSRGFCFIHIILSIRLKPPPQKKRHPQLPQLVSVDSPHLI
jgi:hypothetical protein